MVKNVKNIFLRNQEADDFETWHTASGTRVLPIFHMMILGWPWLFLWQDQICFRMLLHVWKLTQHWVLMYFQVCSNSTYPQHRWATQGQWSPGWFLYRQSTLPVLWANVGWFNWKIYLPYPQREQHCWLHYNQFFPFHIGAKHEYKWINHFKPPVF